MFTRKIKFDWLLQQSYKVFSMITHLIKNVGTKNLYKYNNAEY